MPWTGWRGPDRNGITAWLPAVLPDPLPVVWRQPLTGQALAGVAADEHTVLVADRDVANQHDIYRAFSIRDGAPQWTVEHPSTGRLDYGNGARATPQLAGGRAFVLNAFGTLHAIQLNSGRVLWQKDLLAEFGGRDRRNPWGCSASPLVIDDRLIVNPGGPAASIVALAQETGSVIWKSPGNLSAFSSFISGEAGGITQIIGYDKESMGGWAPADGRRLWTLRPEHSGDFNVPTPLLWNGKLLVATENNGCRLYAFAEGGVIQPAPIATNELLAPDTHTPVALGRRVFGVWMGLHCLDLQTGLTTIWSHEEDAFSDYAVILASGDRVLVVTKFGELILLDATANTFQAVSRQKVFQHDPGVYAHPALVGSRLLLRGSKEIVCLELAP